MTIPDISSLTLSDRKSNTTPLIPDDILSATDKDTNKLKCYAGYLPYSIESIAKGHEILDLILLRLAQCVEAKDYDPGFLQWDTKLSRWLLLRYPIPKDKRIKLCKLYFHMCTTPGMPIPIVSTCVEVLRYLTRTRKKLPIEDMRLPWKPIYDILKQDLFVKGRDYESSHLSWYMGYIAESLQRFFHPAAIEAMLETFVPLINGTDVNSVLSSQYYLLSFLPMSHPQSYLPMLFRMWESVNSYLYDERMLDFLAALTELHVDPSLSDPRKIHTLPDDERSDGEARPRWSQTEVQGHSNWPGLYKDVGIFTVDQWNMLICKCVASMEIELADSGSLTTGPSVDQGARWEIDRLPKPNSRIQTLAKIIVYSMAPDGPIAPTSSAPTPYFTPLPSGTNTPRLRTGNGNGNGSDFLTAPFSKKEVVPDFTFLAGSRALDSLAKFIASVESFFHPTNSGHWTADLTTFINCLASEFNKRWYEEQLPDCKTPQNRRLTKQMKRDFVKALRTVALLAIFSENSLVVSQIQGTLKSMCIMEPDLILHPILERAMPSLETLVETERTIAVIKALTAVAPAIVRRETHYPGAKHLIPILELLVPGIDVNDPSKTLCTATFLVEISRYIKFDDLTVTDDGKVSQTDSEFVAPSSISFPLPSFEGEVFEDRSDLEPRLSNEEEDALLRDRTANFATWITSFIRRVIQLFENLSEENENNTWVDDTEAQMIDAVTIACYQICAHLSEPLYDRVLEMIFEYTSTNVRPNAVRVIYLLVQCVARVNPAKTVPKFLPSCCAKIRIELEHGASSERTTSATIAVPSDATLHWNLALLRGILSLYVSIQFMVDDHRRFVKFSDCRSSLLMYQDEILSLFRLLRDKTFSKFGYHWSTKLVFNILWGLTFTYPLESRFVNPDEWESEEFRKSHHLSWGKLYKPEDVKVAWHVPEPSEIDFTLRIFRELIEPTLTSLEKLLDDGVNLDLMWRNDFCRYLSFVGNAFAAIPTLTKEHISPEEARHALETTDHIEEISEMIVSIEPVNSGFCITDPADHRYQYMLALRTRFAHFLHKACGVLQKQGEENILDAVLVLIWAIQIYLLDYGDSRYSHYTLSDNYENARDVVRLYDGQKVWPREIHVARARTYHTARLWWNSIERLRGPLQDQLICDVVEWSVWQYATVRQYSQSLLEPLIMVYDGVRRLALPILYKALEPGTEDGRMKGALWTLNKPVFFKYAISNPILAVEFVKRLFDCQHNGKPSIQNLVTVVFENCFNNAVEPQLLVYEVDNPALTHAVQGLKSSLSINPNGDKLVGRCEEMRVQRVRLMDDAVATNAANIFEIAKAPHTHWRYRIGAVRSLGILVRRDKPSSESLMSYMLEATCDSHPSMRLYATHTIIKCLRYIKLRSLHGNPSDLVFGRIHNPLKVDAQVVPSHAWTSAFLGAYRTPVDINSDMREPIFCDSISQGWLAWSKTVTMYKPPEKSKSTFQPWEKSSEAVVECLRNIATNPSFWEELSKRYAEENHKEVIDLDNVACIKSIFQILDDAPFEALRPTLERLIVDDDYKKHQAAAELLAGLLRGSKHWPTNAQERVWDWFKPHMKKIFIQNIKFDTLYIWASFFEHMFSSRDPRRVWPLVEFLWEQYISTDYNTESSFDAIKVLHPFQFFCDMHGWKISAWVDEILQRCWPEICNEHDKVRYHVGRILLTSEMITWLPKPSIPNTEAFAKECKLLPLDHDIMGMRGSYHKSRVKELVKNFDVWRKERVPGVRAFQSTYDKVGVTVCNWLIQSLHDIRAIATFDYILPLMPELFLFAEVIDDDDLSDSASLLLVRMCGVTPPTPLVGPLLDAIYDAIRNSPSWRVRLQALPLIQVFYFRQFPLISDEKIVEMLEILCQCLDDTIVEVREKAAETLSGILRLSPRRSILSLKDRFVRQARASHLPSRDSPDYNKAICKRHAAILGACALVDSYPYTVEKWMPDLMAKVLAEHTYDPIPISTTVRKCASNFRKTHQDTWHEDSKRFSDNQLAALSTLLAGSSYYA